MAYAEEISPFRDIARRSPEPNAISHLKNLDQEKTCHIAEAADMCLMLTQELANLDGVSMQAGYVADAAWSKVSCIPSLPCQPRTWSPNAGQDGEWIVSVKTQNGISPIHITASAELLVLCTGSSPATHPLPMTHLQDIGLDEGLDPVVLSKVLPSDKCTTVAVIGASHSAILVLMNLCNLASTTHACLRIKWFTRHMLRYAEERDGRIFRDNTGLKGEVATWARSNLEEHKLPRSPISKYLDKVGTTAEGEHADYMAHLPDCTHVIQAVGFKRNPLPTLAVNGASPQRLEHISVTGGFEDEQGDTIYGLYGAGIAWPEKVLDPGGDVEYAVGLAKFMRYLSRVVPGWVGARGRPSGSQHPCRPDAWGEKQPIVSSVSATTA